MLVKSVDAAFRVSHRRTQKAAVVTALVVVVSGDVRLQVRLTQALACTGEQGRDAGGCQAEGGSGLGGRLLVHQAQPQDGLPAFGQGPEAPRDERVLLLGEVGLFGIR